jgi:hypothetical protein
LKIDEPVSASVRTVTATGEYRMSDHDTRSEAVQLAVEAAKRQALEQVATYLESVTEVRNMDITRDDIRTYTAGVVTVLEQKITTRLDGDTVVIQADLTAQVDPNEIAQAIATLRENESAKHELAVLRAETDQLHQQLDATNLALATAASADQVRALNQERHEVLTQLQSNALVTQAWTNWVYVGPVGSPYVWIRINHVRGLLLQAQQLSPHNRHLPIMQQTVVAAQTGSMPSAPGISPSVRPPSSLLVPPPASRRISPSPPTNLSPAPSGSSHGLTPSSTPTSPRMSSSPPPTSQRIHPPRLAQPNAPMHRPPSSILPNRPSFSPRHFGGTRGPHLGAGHRGGGSHSGGGGRRGR